MNVRHIIQKGLQMVVVAALLAGCDMMKEDRDDCPTGLYVNFVYDYNMLGPGLVQQGKVNKNVDVFKDHVGYVKLYVFDESDRLVAQRAVSGDQLSVYGFNIHFTEQELAPDHQYRLTAIAMQTDWDEALSTQGAKYRKTEPAIGDSRQMLSVSLDRDKEQSPSEVNAEAPLDILWHTLQVMPAYAANQPAKTVHNEKDNDNVETNGVETVTLHSGVPTYATVSLIRDTKHLNITLGETGNGDVDYSDYEVYITDANGDVDYQNTVVTPTDMLVYRPYAMWNTPVENEGAHIGQTAHYDLMFNRLMYRANSADNAQLCIHRISDGVDVVKIDLPKLLLNGRKAFELFSYGAQEYLDREYDYSLHFYLSGDHWVSVVIYPLSWAVRKQYEEF